MLNSKSFTLLGSPSGNGTASYEVKELGMLPVISQGRIHRKDQVVSNWAFSTLRERVATFHLSHIQSNLLYGCFENTDLFNATVREQFECNPNEYWFSYT